MPPGGSAPGGEAAGWAPPTLAGDQTPFDAFRLKSSPTSAQVPGSAQVPVPAAASVQVPAPAAGGIYGAPVQPPTAAAPMPMTMPEPAPMPEQKQPSAEEPPVPRVRSGRVLLAVLCAAVLLLVVPLGIVWLATRPSGPTFDVGSCLRKSGNEAVAAQCSDDAFKVVSKVDNKNKCTPGQPYVTIGDGGKDNILCLRPVAGE